MDRNQRSRADDINAWWEDRPGEHYWLDVTNRDDGNRCLAAPQGEGWMRRLVTYVRGGDIVFHFDAAQNAIVAASVCHGRVQKRQLSWAMPAENEGAEPLSRTLPSWGIRLRQSTRLGTAVSLDEIARIQWGLYPALRALEDKVGDPLYYPFEMDKIETTRILSGYALKLPAILVRGIPGLASAAAMWQRSHEAHARAPLPSTQVRLPDRGAGLMPDSPLQRLMPNR